MKVIYLTSIVLLFVSGCIIEQQPIPQPYPQEQNITVEENATNTTPEPIEVKEPVLIPVNDKLAIYVLDMSKKTSIIATLNNKSVLVNAQGDSDGLKLLKAIKNLGIKKLDYFILTNSLEDNIKGASSIILRMPIEEMIHSGIPSSDYYYLQYTSFYKKNITVVPLDTILPYEDGSISLNVPYDDGMGVGSDNSIVVNFDYGSTSVLFLNDCGIDCESRISNLRGNIIISNGACDSLSLSLLQQTMPETIIFTSNICEETLNRVKNLNIPFKQTSVDGDITIISDGFVYEVKSYKN